MNVSDLCELIIREWPFDAASYPCLQGASSSEVLRFALDHITKHQQKSLGLVANALERADHGYEIDELCLKELRTPAIKMVVNALRLALMLGMSIDEIELNLQQHFHDAVRFTQTTDTRTGEHLHHPSKGL